MYFFASDYKNEILRKTIHLSSLWMPVLYFFSTKEIMLMVLGVMTIIIVMLDGLRIIMPSFRHFTSGILGRVMRLHEHGNKLSGASYMLIGGLLTVAIFSKPVAITSLMVLMIADSCASLVGKRFGKTPLLTKSVEGTLAFALSGGVMVVICGALFHAPISFIIAGMLGVMMGAYVELMSGIWQIDDNLTIPLAVGAVMTLTTMIL